MATKRYSRQRERICRAVLDTTEHLTAEMVYQRLKPESPSLSLGTVYRNLNRLVEEGCIVKLPFPVERFDGITEPHAHFLCGKCGRVFDMPDVDYDSALDAKAGAVYRHTVRRHELIFYGSCADCAEDDEK
ncbi:MAG: transcriptional repressor [Oscillospiraceae bacterium]|jgi:Fur family peroxide stress response transcriptional regulator|nr:transcriptional repressor [Oscillospiraceae bacterium]